MRKTLPWMLTAAVMLATGGLWANDPMTPQEVEARIVAERAAMEAKLAADQKAAAAAEADKAAIMAKMAAERAATRTATENAAARAANAVKVYQSAFEKQAGAEWSQQTVTKCPSGKYTFLGPFGSQGVTLTLDNLPAHARVQVSFDLLIMLTWDGDASMNVVPEGPDVFDVTVDRGPRLVHASFVARPSDSTTTQSFPGRFPYDHYRFGTGAAETGSLGYHWNGGVGTGADDYVYHITRTFGHTGKSLPIVFSGINLESLDNESWGLANVKVEVLPEAAEKLDETAFNKWYTTLGSIEPKLIPASIEGIIDLGDPAVALIRQRLALPKVEKVQETQIRQLIVQLDDDSYQQREKASAVLREMGITAEPILREVRANSPAPEVSARIDDLLARMKIAPSDRELRRCRLVEVLERINTNDARAALQELAHQPEAFAAWEAKGALQRLEGKAPVPTKLVLPPGMPKGLPHDRVPTVIPVHIPVVGVDVFLID